MQQLSCVGDEANDLYRSFQHVVGHRLECMRRSAGGEQVRGEEAERGVQHMGLRQDMRQVQRPGACQRRNEGSGNEISPVYLVGLPSCESRWLRDRCRSDIVQAGRSAVHPRRPAQPDVLHRRGDDRVPAAVYQRGETITCNTRGEDETDSGAVSASVRHRHGRLGSALWTCDSFLRRNTRTTGRTGPPRR